MIPAVCALIAFLCGAIPTAYWTARRLKGIDIRQHGSGNVGATNAFRVLGRGPGAFVFAVDVLKGAIPMALFAHAEILGALSPAERLAVAAAAVCGHIFNPFLGFRGGKGIAVGTGVLLALYPVCLAASVAVWLIIFACTRIVSAASVSAVPVLVLAGIATGQDSLSIYFFVGLSLVTFVSHRQNIRRIIRGEEKKIG